MVHLEINDADLPIPIYDVYLNCVSPVKHSQMGAVLNREGHRHSRHTNFADGAVRDGEPVSRQVDVSHPNAGPDPVRGIGLGRLHFLHSLRPFGSVKPCHAPVSKSASPMAM